MRSLYALRGIAILGAVCAAAVAALAEDAPVLEAAAPRQAAWKDVTRSLFEPRWILPEQRVDETVSPKRRARDLVADMVRFAALEFPPASGESAEPNTKSVGNLLHALGRLETDAQRRSLLARLRRTRPSVHRRVGGLLFELVLQARLDGDDWDPDDDSPDDGVLLAPPVRRDVGNNPHYDRLSGDENIYQAAIFVRADTATIKEAENDYGAYPSHVGSEYEMIHAVRDSYVCGKDPDGRPFSALRIAFRCDLPFPYSTYTCDLRILNQVGADGLLRTHIYSPSEDFHWLAGQDVYIPVKTTTGELAGTLLVRLYGFDIDDVPDGEGARQAALRGSLGNLKRRAERLSAAGGAKASSSTDALPSFRVRGLEPR